MGICSSCLGLNRNRDLPEDDENSRLLFDDAHPNHYGSFGDSNVGIIQVDPQEVQRENEALQRVVAQTSNHLVDIFAMVPQNVPPPTSTLFSAQDARLLRYQDVLAKISTKDQSARTTHLSAESTPNMPDGWISEEDDEDEIKGQPPIKSAHVGPLLGGFADAEAMD